MSWLRLDVAGLDAGSTATRRYEASGSIRGLQAGLGKVDEHDSIRVDLDLTVLEGSVRVQGRVSGRVNLDCSRCLVGFVRDLDLGVREYFYYSAQTAEAKDGWVVEDESVDLEPVLRDAILLSIPIKPVHAEDCKGLCPTCGADRNLVDCRHEQAIGDPRWAPLSGLMDKELIDFEAGSEQTGPIDAEAES